MIDIEDLTAQVLHNCNLSDSRHAGLYSICGLAMRLRDLYKWEKGLEPWIEKDSTEILTWIGEKEDIWEDLVDQEFHAISLEGKKYDPFEVDGINGVLEPYRLIYGAGYVHSLKPTFFLGRLEEKRRVNGHIVYILGRELARDILTIPALSQGDSVFIRKESAKFFFWDHIFFINKSGKNALKFAFENHGLIEQRPEHLHRNLDRIFDAELETYIHHELGELKETAFDREAWRDIIANYSHTPIELLARTVKDLLADTNEHGVLQYITREKRTASLGFYVAFLDGLRKELFPELINAFPEFVRTRNWQTIDRAVSSGYDTARHYAEVMTRIYQEGRRKNDMKWTEMEINTRLLTPLGILKRNE